MTKLSDSFAYSNGTLPDPPWGTPWSGYALPDVVSGHIEAPTSGSTAYYAMHDTQCTTQAQVSQAVATITPAGATYHETNVLVRMSGTTNLGGYQFSYYYDTDSAYHYALFKDNPAGGFSTLAGPIAATSGAKVLRIEIDTSNNIVCKVDGVTVLTFTDSSSPLTGTGVGLGVYRAAGTASSVQMDTWRAGDIPANIGYRTFNGTTDTAAATLAELAGAAHSPGTYIWAGRVLSVTADAELASVSGFDPLDDFMIAAPPAHYGFWDGAVSNNGGPTITTGVDVIITKRLQTASNLKWSIASNSGSGWSTTTFTTDGSSNPARSFPGSGNILFSAATNPANVRFALYAHCSSALSDADVNALTTDLQTWLDLPNLTNLWRFDGASIVDLKGTSTQTTLTGTSATANGFPLPGVESGATAPDAPTTPILDSAWNGAIHGFLLSAPADNGSSITGYKWQVAPQVAGSPGTATTVSGQTTMELNASGLTNGTPYYARVAATNAIGDSSYSSWAGPITPVDLGEFDRISSTQSILLGTGNALRLENFPATYPASVDVANRYIKDQNGNPWLCAGDTAWSIVAALNTTDISLYVANRRAKGVTAVIASLPEPYYAPNAPNNLAGQAPFTGSAFASSLNNSYWTVVDHFLNECKTAGITVFACWFYLGFPGGPDGWAGTIDGVTSTNMRDYADAIYARYPPSTYPHIVHFIGHDRVPTSTQETKGLAFIDQLRNVHGDPRLFIYGGVHPRDINGTDTFGIGAEDWVNAAAVLPPDIDTQYDYSQWNILNADTMHSFSSRPHIGIEFIYDEEQSNGTGTLLTRSQLWGPWADGGNGGFVGVNPIWNFENHALFGFTFGWKASMDLKGSLILKAFRWIVGTHCAGWERTTCDINSVFVTNRGTNGNRVAARFNNRLGIIYVKDYSTATWPLTLNLSNFTAWSIVKITRVDPMTGERVVIDASESTSNTAFALASPGTTNSEGATNGKDWLFLVEGVS